jgi:hypothetical protein
MAGELRRPETIRDLVSLRVELRDALAIYQTSWVRSRERYSDSVNPADLEVQQRTIARLLAKYEHDPKPEWFAHNPKRPPATSKINGLRPTL